MHIDDDRHGVARAGNGLAGQVEVERPGRSADPGALGVTDVPHDAARAAAVAAAASPEPPAHAGISPTATATTRATARLSATASRRPAAA